jgi:hypothetical protein
MRSRLRRVASRVRRPPAKSAKTSWKADRVAEVRALCVQKMSKLIGRPWTDGDTRWARGTPGTSEEEIQARAAYTRVRESLLFARGVAQAIAGKVTGGAAQWLERALRDFIDRELDGVQMSDAHAAWWTPESHGVHHTSGKLVSDNELLMLDFRDRDGLRLGRKLTLRELSYLSILVSGFPMFGTADTANKIVEKRETALRLAVRKRATKI